MAHEYIKLKVISNETNIPTVASFIADLVQQLGFSDRKRMLICFAVESILDMRLKHIGADNPYVEIEVNKNAENVYISVRDKGQPYILSENQRKIISRGLADSYRLEQLASEGQKLTLILKQETGGEIALPEMEEEELLDGDVTITGMSSTEEDINEAIRCMYSAYGYDYIHQAMYRIDHFKELIDDRIFLPALAKNAHGQVLGLGALVKDGDFPGLYEISNLATKPFARGKGVAKKLVENLFTMMPELQADGIYCCPVAFHTATQKICEAAGMTPSGFILHGFPPSAAGSFRDGNRRLDYALCANLTDKQKMHTLYLADEIRDLTLEFFRTERVPVCLMKTESLTGDTVIAMGYDAFTSTASMIADGIGADFEARITAILDDRDVRNAEMVMLFLNASKPGADIAFRMLHERGFLYTGGLPGSANGDYIILQQLRGAQFERGKIKLTPVYSDLLNRILAINE